MSPDLMYNNMVTIVDCTVLYNCNLLKVQTLKVLIKDMINMKKKKISTSKSNQNVN